METGLHTLAIAPAGAGAYSVSLDGVDVSTAVSGIDLQFRSGQPAAALIALSPQADVSAFEGLARVEVAEPSAGTEVEDFLAAIDPEILESEALANLGLGDGGSMAGAFLTVLQRWARGDV